VKDFFISYNGADKNWAEWIAWQLEEAGYTTVLQAWDFRPGQNFVLEMDGASKETGRTIVVLSPNYLDSSFAPSEWAVAFKKDPTGEKGMIVPVRVKKCDLEGLLSPIDRIDLIGLDEDAATKALLGGIKPGRAKPSTKPGFPGMRSVPTKPSFPGALPAQWNLPNRNPNFTGRDSLLNDLRRSLASGKPAALYGLGGIGKSQLAAEYAYRYSSDYNVVWWIRSGRPTGDADESTSERSAAESMATDLATDFARLATELDLPQKYDRDLSVIVGAVRRWLEQNKRWLLIFDNAELPSDLRNYLPRTDAGHVIITARNPNWGNTATPLEVVKFDRKESVKFLIERTRQDDGKAADALADALGDLPLALEQAGAYIEETGDTLTGYLSLFLERQESILKRGKPVDYHATVDATWEISFWQAKKESKAGSDLLNLCAFLAADNIQEQLLIEGAQELPGSLASAIADKMRFNDAVAALRRYSLISRGKGSFSVHRLVQSVTRNRLEEDDQKKWAEAAVRLVYNAFPTPSHDFRTWPACEILLPHALAASEQAERLKVAPDATGGLLNNIGPYLAERAEYDGSKSVLERALMIFEDAYGPEHPEVARTANNLGLVLLQLGDFEGAKECHERALKVEEQAYGPNHPNVARTVEGLGLVLDHLGDLEGAKECHERALKINEQAYGQDHPEVAQTVNNLGLVLLQLGDFEGAKKHFERALKIFRNRLGEDHPDTVKTRKNLDALEREIRGER